MILELVEARRAGAVATTMLTMLLAARDEDADPVCSLLPVREARIFWS